MGRVTAITITLFCISCSSTDYGLLEASSLTISPCTGKDSRTFAPLRLEASMLRWFESGNVGGIEMRDGFQTPNASDAAVIVFADIEAIRNHLQNDPLVPMPIDGQFIRASVALRASCPDATVPIEGYDGSLVLFELDTDGGRVAGIAKMDLWDRRARESHKNTPLATDVTMTFDFKVREGRPYEDYSD